MTVDNFNNPTTRLEPAKMIVCMLPDDGTDIKIMHQLREEKDITRAESIACRGVNDLQAAEKRREKLPEPTLYRILTIIVTEAEADDVFDFVHEKAQIGQQGRGVLVQSTILGATRYAMPDDVPEEPYKP